MSPAHVPARALKRRSPSRTVKKTAASAAIAMGSWAVVSVTRPPGMDSSLIAHGYMSGLLR